MPLYNIAAKKPASGNPNDAVILDSLGNFTGVAPSTSGNVLTSNGTAWVSSAPASAVTSSYELYNLGLSASVATNALTIALKQADGTTDPAAGTSAVKIGFRSATATSGAYSEVSATAATSITVPSGASLGQASAMNQYVWVYALDNAGTVELAVSGIKLFDDYSIQSSTTIGAGSTSGSTLYSTTGRSNVPIRLIGRILVNEATAGTWATTPAEVALVSGKQPATTTDWATVTVTGSFTTNTTYTASYRRVGSNMQLMVSQAFTGAPNATTASITVPLSLTMDSTLPAFVSGAGPVLGDVTASIATAGYKFYAYYSSSTVVGVAYQSSTTGAAAAVSQGAFSFTNGDAILYNIEIPIAGWYTYGA